MFAICIVLMGRFLRCLAVPQSGVFLLLCPTNEHFVWCGGAFAAHEAGVDMTDCSEDDVPSADSLLKWAAQVLPGEVSVDGTVGGYLLNNPAVMVEM